MPGAEHEWANTVGIAERDDAEADDHCDDGIAAATASVDGLHSLENLIGCRLAISAHVQLMRKNI